MARKRFTRGSGSKRHGSWSSSTAQTAFVALGGSSILLSQVFVPFDAGETVIRTRGLFGWMSDQSTADEEQMGAIGIGVVTEQAATLGASAVPAPDTDAGWDGWLWHSYFASKFEFITGAGFDQQGMSRITIDSKAMRKVGDNERIVVVVQNSSPTGLLFYDQIRIYSKPF